MKYAYLFCGFVVTSDLPLPELGTAPKLARGERVIAVEVSQSGSKVSRPQGWFLRQNLSNGCLWSARARIAEGYLLHFNELADFKVDRSGERISCVWRHPETADLTLRAILLDHVMPLAITLRGNFVLHAAAALKSTGVCAFIGYSGVGKSTIVARLAATGNDFLTDDCLVIDREAGKFIARASHPGMKLREDSIEFLNPNGTGQPVADYTTKQRIHSSAFGASSPREPRPISRLYFLERDEDGNGFSRPVFERLSRQAAFLKLIQHSIRLDPTDRTMLIREFEFVWSLVHSVPAARLFLPNDFSALDFVDETISSDLLIK